MKTRLFLCFLLLVVGSIHAQTPKAIGKPLGEMPRLKTETLPAIELYNLVKANPAATVAVVTGTCTINPNVTEYHRWFYDREKRILVSMERLVMRFSEDHTAWRIWNDVSPEDFREKLPYMNERIHSTPSPSRDAKAAFPINYPENPSIVTWP